MWESLLQLRDRPPVQFRPPPAGVVHSSQSVKYDVCFHAIELQSNAALFYSLRKVDLGSQ